MSIDYDTRVDGSCFGRDNQIRLATNQVRRSAQLNSQAA
jgi:hypothetical protein